MGIHVNMIFFFFKGTLPTHCADVLLLALFSFPARSADESIIYLVYSRLSGVAHKSWKSLIILTDAVKTGAPHK